MPRFLGVFFGFQASRDAASRDAVGPESQVWQWRNALENHPSGCKWLITMGNKSPNWGDSPSKWPKWLINGGDPKHLLSGMILQVGIATA